jgi:Predicted secreted endonuclease distantly related to archaeal Holliday junction resolvase
MSQYVFLIGLLLVLFAVAVLVAYLIARIKEYEEILERDRAWYENLLEKREREREELLEQIEEYMERYEKMLEKVKEYEKNIAVLNEQMEMLEKERVRYENLLEEREQEKEELSERLKEYEKINKELFEQLKEYEKNIAVLNEQMDKSAYERAQKLFEEWMQKELEKLKDVIKKEYENLFEKWKNEYEEKIREDSRKKSLATILGKVGEELTPLLMFEKLGIEPKDFRHIGTPIDYVAFKGLSNGKVEEIVFIEVKTANSPSLSDREKEVRKAVDEKRVRFVMINLKEELYNFRFE